MPWEAVISFDVLQKSGHHNEQPIEPHVEIDFYSKLPAKIEWVAVRSLNQPFMIIGYYGS